MEEHIEGIVERILYYNPDNSFSILKVNTSLSLDLSSNTVTVVGNIPKIACGDYMRFTGVWRKNIRYGNEFSISRFEYLVPTTASETEKFLASGVIHGIGPATAKRIVRIFGAQSIDIIENDMGRLYKVPGIGKKRIDTIRKGWHAYKDSYRAIIDLQKKGITVSQANKIYKKYGDNSVKIITDNPYRLASEIEGIGFIKADSIAEKLGISKNAAVRLESGIIFILNHMSAAQGHVFIPYDMLIAKASEFLKIDVKNIVSAIDSLVLKKDIVVEEYIKDGFSTDKNKCVFLSGHYACEKEISVRILDLKNSKPVKITCGNNIENIASALGITLTKSQIHALDRVVANSVTVISGGPGTGKTTIIKVLVAICRKSGLGVSLSAPTGRAAKRLAEATGHAASTIHRLLDYIPGTGSFRYNEVNKLDCDLLVIDESSMIDSMLMHHLLKAVKAGTRFVLVGDNEQLPSVGAGNILGDIIKSETLDTVYLKEIFRQDKDSGIVRNAHLIIRGIQPDLTNKIKDFYFIEQDDPLKVNDIIIRLVTDRIPSRFGYDPFTDIQVISPMKKGAVGTEALNINLQKIFNSSSAKETEFDNLCFRVGDKVIQIKNDYDKEVFNGDIGKLIDIDSKTGGMKISFDDRTVIYDKTDLHSLRLAYAITVHKSQGGEYPVIIMPVITQHAVLLCRNLLYTAVTRAKNLVILVGSKKALSMAVENTFNQNRYTKLSERLKENTGKTVYG